jgi:hypothetical protein
MGLSTAAGDMSASIAAIAANHAYGTNSKRSPDERSDIRVLLSERGASIPDFAALIRATCFRGKLVFQVR